MLNVEDAKRDHRVGITVEDTIVRAIEVTEVPSVVGRCFNLRKTDLNQYSPELNKLIIELELIL